MHIRDSSGTKDGGTHCERRKARVNVADNLHAGRGSRKGDKGWGRETNREWGEAWVDVADSLDAGAGAQVARPGQRDAHDGHRDGAQRSDRLQLPAYAGASARHSPFCGACLPAAEESVHTLAGTVCACLVQADLKVCDSLRASMCGRSAPEGNSDIASMLGPIKVQLSLAPGL